MGHNAELKNFMEAPYQPTELPDKALRPLHALLHTLMPALDKRVIEGGRPADTTLRSCLQARPEIGARDRRFLSQAVFRHFRWYGWTTKRLALNFDEAALVSAALEEQLPSQWMRYLNATLALSERINPMGSLRLEERGHVLSRIFKQRLEGHLVLADLTADIFSKVIPTEYVEPCIRAFQKRPTTWIRSRTEPETLINALKSERVDTVAHAVLTRAIGVPPGTNLRLKLADHAGKFVVQDMASQCVGSVCAPRPGEAWWDCCTGTGGKALHLNDLMEQKGCILATDKRNKALQELRKRARKCGIRAIKVQVHDAEHAQPMPPGFDGVLVDGPCSGWGTWGRNPDARWRTSRKEIARLAKRQYNILNRTARSVKPGGRLVYAACTITRPETEEVVTRFLEEHSSFDLETLINPLTRVATDGQLQIWPDDHDGMFIARFRNSKTA